MGGLGFALHLAHIESTVLGVWCNLLRYIARSDFSTELAGSRYSDRETR